MVELTQSFDRYAALLITGRQEEPSAADLTACYLNHTALPHNTRPQ